MKFINLKPRRLMRLLVMALILLVLIERIQNESVKPAYKRPVTNNLKISCEKYFSTLYGIILENKSNLKRLSKMKEWQLFIKHITRAFNVCDRYNSNFRRWLLREG
jgi:hypothetical protein